MRGSSASKPSALAAVKTMRKKPAFCIFIDIPGVNASLRTGAGKHTALAHDARRIIITASLAATLIGRMWGADGPTLVHQAVMEHALALRLEQNSVSVFVRQSNTF